MSIGVRRQDGGTPIGPVGQIGLVVQDIARAADHYGGLFGIGAWDRYTYGPGFVPELEYRGRPSAYSMHIALAGSGPQIELIEPVAGPSLYTAHLDTHGPGLHHLGVFVDCLDEAIATMTGQGYELLQLGRGFGADGDGGFAYFGTAHHPTLVEAIERPRRRKPPLAAWPVKAAPPLNAARPGRGDARD
ncbi:VOC family protein [Streptomyces sp. NPDC055078]